LNANDLLLHDLGRRFFRQELRFDLDAVIKHARYCSEVQVVRPRDLIVADLLALGVDLVDRPPVGTFVLWLCVQPEPMLQMKIHRLLPVSGILPTP
jgi:hypothetical protein